MKNSRPRGRPLSFDKEATLDKVLPVFWRRGFASPSLDELAAATGLNRPNLAAAFGDKRRLYLATLEKFQSKFTSDASRALGTPGTLQGGLDRFFEHAVSVYAGEALGCFIFGTAPGASGDDAEIRAALAGGLHGVQSGLKQRLSEAVGYELASEADIEGLTVALTGMLLTLALHARAGTAAPTLRKMYRRAVPTILKGSLAI